VRLKYPRVLIWHNANGGSRKKKLVKSKKTGKIKWVSSEGAALQKDGVLAGVPDLFVAKPILCRGTIDCSSGCSCLLYSGLFIEMKSARGKLSDSQIDVMNKLSEEGYKCEVCYSSEEAIKVIDEYLS
jgi:hypothetical protein